MKYDFYLNKLTVKELKDIIKKYKLHVLFTMSGKKKSELVNHLLDHTDLIGNEIVLKNKVIVPSTDRNSVKKINKVRDKEMGRLAGNLGRTRAVKENLKDQLKELLYDDAHYVQDPKHKKSQKEINKKEVDKIEKLIRDAHNDLVKASEDFKKFKN
jgi:Glu-tRNA(Gln) amidotransferase subunit E-like FAD-binding protein